MYNTTRIYFYKLDIILYNHSTIKHIRCGQIVLIHLQIMKLFILSFFYTFILSYSVMVLLVTIKMCNNAIYYAKSKLYVAYLLLLFCILHPSTRMQTVALITVMCNARHAIACHIVDWTLSWNYKHFHNKQDSIH